MRFAWMLVTVLMSADMALAAPVVGGVSGTVADGGAITITGSGFGAGPAVKLFDDFEGGSAGDAIPLTSPKVGQWSSASHEPVYDGNSHSGATGCRIYDGDTQRQFRLSFGGDYTEVFFSFWVRVPNGTCFPGNGEGGTDLEPGEFSFDSSWKFTWLFNDNGCIGDGLFDCCMPTHIGLHGSFLLAGNDGNYKYLPSPSAWWSWTSWMRMTFWTRGLPGNGRAFWQTVSAEHGQALANYSTPVFVNSSHPDGFDQNCFDAIHFPGWLRSGSGANVRPVYDDIYVALGANAQARVELGDAAQYAQCRNLALCTPTSWTTGSIKATVRAGSFGAGDPIYVFVVDKDGNASAGRQVQLGAGPPLAPGGLQVRE